MTRRITISLPDDVADYAERAGGNTSGFIASVLRRRMSTDALRAQWAAAGYVISDEDVDRMRQRLAQLPPITDEQHAANLAWLANIDHPHAA
jgi:hypothetical protein